MPKELGKISTAVADTGYFSENNIKDCKKADIKPIISTAREKHNTYLEDKLNSDNVINHDDTPVGK